MEFSETELRLSDDESAAIDKPLDDATTCTIIKNDGKRCANPRKPYGGRGKRPTKCEDCSTSRVPGTSAEAVKNSARWKDKMEQQLSVTMLGVAQLVNMFDERDAVSVITGTPLFVTRTVELAEADPKFRKAVDQFLKGNAYAAWTAAAAVIVVPILANHGMLPKRMTALMEQKPAEAA